MKALAYKLFFISLVVAAVFSAPFAKASFFHNAGGDDSCQSKEVSVASRIVDYAKTFLGTPYKYGSMLPEIGFDCSGFINHVFNHFEIPVPRSSYEFTNKGISVPLAECRPGDLILFTGSNKRIRKVGHIAIVISNDNGNVKFIHSSSGKKYGVIITDMNNHYIERFVKVVRMVP